MLWDVNIVHDENQFNKNGKIKLNRIAFHFKIKRIKEQTQSD